MRSKKGKRPMPVSVSAGPRPHASDKGVNYVKVILTPLDPGAPEIVLTLTETKKLITALRKASDLSREDYFRLLEVEESFDD